MFNKKQKMTPLKWTYKQQMLKEWLNEIWLVSIRQSAKVKREMEKMRRLGITEKK